METIIHNFTERPTKKILNGLTFEGYERGLTFSRSDITELKVFSVSSILKETCAMLQNLYKQEFVALNLNMTVSNNDYVFGNRGRIQQVIINLFNNAKDATEGLNERIINCMAWRDQNFIRISVEDNGVGFSPEIKEKIFEPFFSTKDVNKGTGIGLSLVASIIKEHDGKIEAISELGKGSTFTISLPLNDQNNP